MKNKNRYQLNEDLVIYADDGALYLWLYSDGQLYELDLESLNKISNFIFGDASEFSIQEFGQLIDEKIITTPVVNNWEWGMAAKLFHESTKFKIIKDVPDVDPLSEDVTDLCFIMHQSFKNNDVRDKDSLSEKLDNLIPLSNPQIDKLESTSIYSALINRKTTRQFNGAPLEESVLATILYICFAELPLPWEGLDSRIIEINSKHRTSPSGAGLHANEVFVYVINVSGVNKGIYKYLTKSHQLQTISSFEGGINFKNIFGSCECTSGIDVLLCMSSDFEKTWTRYKNPRAYRTALLDIGHLSQTVNLVCSSLGVSTWASTNFDDDFVCENLNINYNNSPPIIFIGIGYGCGTLSKNFIQHVENSLSRRRFFENV